MKDFELFSAFTDVDDQYVLEVLEAMKKPVRRRKTRRIVTVVMIITVALVAGIVAIYSLIQVRKNNTLDGTSSNNDERSGVATSKTSVTKHAVCEDYQFLSIHGKTYIASVEFCDEVEAEIGIFQVRNDPEESHATSVKEVTVYEIAGMDSAIGVAVRFPEQQEFYVYYFEE
ncbi:MAG: hypothetical protein IKI15_02310 [Lachnospiraceae bacterium]|nr:hypothetical protein [Lachnospiraceae bacterium]